MDGLRKLQFMVKGYRNFTKWETAFPPLQGTLKGVNFVITGANSGIGFAAAKNAALREASVYIVCRNEERGLQAVHKLKELTKNDNIFLVLGEMGQIDQMNKAYDSLQNKIPKIDVLVHNAGCMILNQQFNAMKIEKNFATNTFAVYYFTKKCIPLLHAKSRVIVVSSGGCLTQPLVVDDLYMSQEKFDGTDQYARNKRQQLCLVQEFARLYEEKGKFVAMHPGWVDTPSVRSSMPDFYEKMKDKLKCEDEGADTILYLSLCKFQNIVNGEFYYDRQVVSKHLPISFTGYKQKEVDLLMKKLQALSEMKMI